MQNTILTLLVVSLSVAHLSVGKSGIALHRRANGPDACITCLNNIAGPLEALLDVANDRSVATSCENLCLALTAKSRSDLAGASCDLVCQAFSFEQFLRIVKTADLNPVRYCQVAQACPSECVRSVIEY
jgi:hypothetical protein